MACSPRTRSTGFQKPDIEIENNECGDSKLHKIDPVRVRHSQIHGLILRRGGLAPISAEGPAHTKGGIKTVRAVGVKVVRSAQGLAVAPEPIHLMLCGAQLEVFWQFETDSDRTLVGDRQPGCRV